MSRGGRPLELPGLYWDEEKRRYFLIASKPKAKPTEDSQPLPQNVDGEDLPSGKRPTGAPTLKMLREMRRGGLSYSSLVHTTHKIHGNALGFVYNELKPTIQPSNWFNNRLTALHTATLDGTLNLIVGDAGGILHCSRVHPLPKSVTPVANTPDGSFDPNAFNDNARLFTAYCTGTGAPISHVTRSDGLAVAISSVYDGLQLAIRDLRASDDTGVYLPRIKRAGDVWAADFLDRRLALGMARKLFIVDNLEAGATPQDITTIPMTSDVLSIAQLPNVLFAGCRSGEIRLFDVRTPECRLGGSEILGGRFKDPGPSFQGKGVSRNRSRSQSSRKSHSAVTHLHFIRDWELLVGTSAGNLELFDRRFCTGTSQPIMTFEGHVNSHLLDLGIAIDPSSSFLFAAGQDCRIRGWSLRTGDPLYSSSKSSDGCESNLGGLFNDLQLNSPARALQVTDGPLRLWTLQDEGIRSWRMGGLS